MKFGHFCLPTYFPDVDEDVGLMMRRWLDILSESEAMGFDFLWANEHHFDSYGGLIPSPPRFPGGALSAGASGAPRHLDHRPSPAQPDRDRRTDRHGRCDVRWSGRVRNRPRVRRIRLRPARGRAGGCAGAHVRTARGYPQGLVGRTLHPRREILQLPEGGGLATAGTAAASADLDVLLADAVKLRVGRAHGATASSPFPISWSSSHSPT